ncbi:MAG TPA: hypothetical protein VK694_04290 [Verrucomicrobiae bacterium]|nr:hypothetical protein [Verrucomicrobiae bacterium]
MASIIQAETRQKEKIKKLKKSQMWMKRGIIAALIVILLLLLLLGYATDWTKGLRKDKTTTPISSNLDSLQGADGAAGAANGGGGTGTNTRTGTNTGTTSNTGTTREGTSTTSTTNNTTTTNPATPTTNQPGVLETLLAQVNAGDTIDDAKTLANSLGVQVGCTQNLIIQTCEFSDGTSTVSTKNLLGTGLITSVIRQ